MTDTYDFIVVGSGYHVADAARMGTDELAVVDSQLRVRGVAGPRIAERAADFIKQDLARG